MKSQNIFNFCKQIISADCAIAYVLTSAESIVLFVCQLYVECYFSCGDMESMSETLFCLIFRFCFPFSFSSALFALCFDL